MSHLSVNCVYLQKLHSRLPKDQTTYWSSFHWNVILYAITIRLTTIISSCLVWPYFGENSLKTPSICDKHFCETNLRMARCVCHFAWHFDSWNTPWIPDYTVQCVSAVYRILVIISYAGSASTNSYVHHLFFAL